MVSLSATSAAPASRSRPSRAGRLVVAAVVALALVGALVAAGLVVAARARPLEVAAGERVSTSAGAFVVTRAETTFVPSTQGPPTAAKMAGTVGTDQLQVWVELAATGERDLAYSEADFRLVDADGSVRAPDGSTLGHGHLQRGASISGQVWFDDAGDVGDSTLEYASPDGRLVRVALTQPEDAPEPSRDGGHGHP